MGRFSVNERTIDNAFQLAAKAAICIPVKGGGSLSGPRQLPFSKGPETTQKNRRNQEKRRVGESSAVFF